MSLKHAILAVLSHGDRTGYDLVHKMDGSVANFWPASHQQVYLELKKLDELGFVQYREKEQKSRPDKKVYKITKTGIGELKSWAEEPLVIATPKDELMIKIFAGHLLEPKHLANELHRVRELHQSKLDEYLAIEKTRFQGKLTPDRLAQYLTLRRGILFEKSWIEWCNESLKRL